MWNVLLVDDDEGIRQTLRAFLSGDGRLTVVGDAANGRDAIRAAQLLRPDAIVLDQQMPEMTGLEALPGLRREVPDAIIVMYSSAPPEAVEPLALEAGADAYFDKAHDPKLVLEAVGKLLGA